MRLSKFAVFKVCKIPSLNSFILNIGRKMIAVAIMDIKYICMVQKKIYVNNPTNSLPLGRELEVVLLQVLVEMGYVESDLWANLMRE